MSAKLTEMGAYTKEMLKRNAALHGSDLPLPDVELSARELEFADAAVLESDDLVRRMVATVDGARAPDACLKPADVEKLVKTALDLNAHLRDRADKLRTAHQNAVRAAQKNSPY